MILHDFIGSTDDVLSVARRYYSAGLSLIPVRADGSKAPRINEWRVYSDRRPSGEKLHAWFASGSSGIGIPGGPASGNLVVFDFEQWAVFERWGGKLSAVEREYLARCPVVRTPSGGAHVYCRLTESVPGSKYAKDAKGKCLIETRGNGHFVVAPGSPRSCHPTGLPYRLLREGWLEGGSSEPIPLPVFHNLTLHAAELNEYVRPVAREVVGDRPTHAATGDRPGDHFNGRVGWGDILCPHGWTVYRSTGAATYWCRPGKEPPGVSASTGICKGPVGGDLLYVFSTSASPLEAEVIYSRFGAYAVLNHHGDFAAATRALGCAGYGVPLPRRTKGVWA